MKATFLPIIQKTLCVLLLAFTLVFGHSLVISASERATERTIRINTLSNCKVSSNEQVLHTAYISEFELRILELTNAERARRGLNLLVWDNNLARAAYLHSKDMAKNNFGCHTGSDGTTPGARAIREGVTWVSFVAENIAAGTRTPERTIEALMGSATHRDNILNESFRYFGIGVYSLDGSLWGVYTTQKFGR